MTTICNQCGKVELCEICHDTFYDSHPFSTGDIAVKVVSLAQQSSKFTEHVMAEKTIVEAPKPQVRFIHSQDTTAVLTEFGKMYYRNGWTCAFIEVDTTKVLVGMATCGGNDVFNRRIGRYIAEGRMKKKPTIITKDPSERAYEVAMQFATETYFEEDWEPDPVGNNTVEEFEEVLG